MRIIKRYKNSAGKTVRYSLINDSGVEISLDVGAVISVSDRITNAKLMRNGEFRANAGEVIDTVIEHNKSLKLCKDTQIKTNKHMPGDYYGKEFIEMI